MEWIYPALYQGRIPCTCLVGHIKVWRTFSVHFGLFSTIWALFKCLILQQQHQQCDAIMYEPKSQRNVCSALLNLGHTELEQFWSQKGFYLVLARCIKLVILQLYIVINISTYSQLTVTLHLINGIFLSLNYISFCGSDVNYTLPSINIAN